MAFLDLDGLEYFKGKENAQIAPVESSNTASQAYEIGECFWYGGNLYKTTHDIASGGTITTSGGDANCELVVLSEKINADKTSVENMISGIESSTTASKDYAVGDYFILYDVLYKVTDAITLGGTITPNTNCVPAKIADDVSNFKSTAEEQISTVEDYALGAYEQKTINNVDIVSFNDGADNIPIKELMVNIEPIQDLHGQDAPYPAGGGKNIVPTTFPSNVINASFSSNGNITAATNARTFAIPCEPNTNYVASSNAGLAATIGLSTTLPAVDGSLTYVCTFTSRTWYDFNSGNNTYIILAFASTDLFNEHESKYQFMIEKGSTSTSFAPFENICPITGWTGCKVTRTGKNLFDKDNATVFYGYLDNGKAIYASGQRIVSIPCKPNTTYTISKILEATTSANRFYSGWSENPIASNVAVNDINGISSGTKGTKVSRTITTGATAAYIAIWVSQSEYYTDAISTLQIEVGSTATDYEAFNGTTLSVTFIDSVGTVYGGTLDLVSGEMVVDRVTDTVSALTQSGTISTGTASACIRFSLSHTSTSVSASSRHGAISNYGKENFAYFGTARVNESGSLENLFAISTGGELLAIYDADTTLTNQQMIDKYADMQVCYPLATPLTYTLTPQEISTLKGENNVWADCGSIAELQYSADPTTSSQESETLIKAIIAPVLTGMVADTALSANDFRIVGDTLYKITASVASGGTLTPNTNCVATTIGEEITSILNS